MVDYELQRLNMVESQVRPSDLTDRRIASAMLRTAREAFLPARLHGVAYSDSELVMPGLEQGLGARAVLAPRTLAQMIQSLALDASDIVLLVGAGCGYEAAVLAQIAQTVVGVEVDAALAARAEQVLEDQGVGNAVIVQGALTDGVANEGPFDAIMINGGVDGVDEALLDQLKDGGRLVAIQQRGGVMRVVRWQRLGEQYSMVEQMAAGAQMLPGFAKEEAFVF